MATTYKFSKPDNSEVQRSSDNAFVPWDAAQNRPLDPGFATRVWQDDGSPVPQPFGS